MRRCRWIGAAVLSAVVALGAGPVAVAQDLEDDGGAVQSDDGADGEGVEAAVPNTIYMADVATNSRLYRLNPTNGAKTLVGSSGVSLTDLSFKGGVLYGVSFTRLYTVNPNTGRATLVGPLNHNTTNALVTQPGTGKLFAAGNAGKFMSVNAATGRATIIGSLGPGLDSAGDLAFLNGVLYASLDKQGSVNTWLARVNLATGQATLIGNMGHRDVFGLTVRNGTLFAATDDGKFLRVTPSNASTVVLGNNGARQAGLATSP